MFRAATPLALFLLIVAPASRAQETRGETPPCWHAPMSALQFVVGEWSVETEHRLPGGGWESTAGRSTIEALRGGCLLEERHQGRRDGRPFDALARYGYNSVSDHLQLVWADSEHGMLTTFEGRAAGDWLVLDHPMVLRGREVVLHRRVRTLPEVGFEVEASRSNDGGTTWEVTGRMRYHPLDAATSPPTR